MNTVRIFIIATLMKGNVMGLYAKDGQESEKSLQDRTS